MNIKWKVSLGLLGLIASLIWLTALYTPDSNLHVIACDVGQGDAILAQYGSIQILIDGGPDNRVLDCLASNMPFWDRELEVVILTHPQKDHFGGLIEVFRRYDIDKLLTTGLENSSQSYQVLKNVVGSSGVEVSTPTTVSVIRLGKVYLDVLWPSKVILSKVEGSSWNPNDFSIVVNMRLGDFDALLTGDIGPAVMDQVIERLVLSGVEGVEYLKIPHHGSKNGLTRELLDLTSPEVAVISVGKNQWGHPHQEVLDMLQERGVDIFRTDLEGDIEVVTNGREWWVE